jgi:hypothetical protein
VCAPTGGVARRGVRRARVVVRFSYPEQGFGAACAARSNATGDANAITRLRRVVVGIDVAVLPLTDPRATRGLLGVDHGVEDVAIETTGGGAAVDARKAGAKEVEGDGFSGASVGVGE